MISARLSCGCLLYYYSDSGGLTFSFRLCGDRFFFRGPHQSLSDVRVPLQKLAETAGWLAENGRD